MHQIDKRLNYSLKLVIVVFYLLISTACTKDTEILKPELQVEFVNLKSPEDIVSITDTLVAPLLYSHLPRIDTLPLAEKKVKFIDAVLPAILIAKYRIEQDRMRLEQLMDTKNWASEDSVFYRQLCDDYKTDNATVLHNRMEVHPNSIILAQAIIESGWGSSRVFREANNMFGIWSYSTRESRIAARFKRDGQTIFLRKYNDFSESIEDYFKTVARTNAYREFRRARLETKDPYKLIIHLKNYSERKEEYVIQLSGMIRFNDLTAYDNHVIDPSYIKPTPTVQ